MSEISETERYKLKKLLKQLSQYKGRHTELVSVYIPAGYDINKVITQIFEEKGTASNIKSTGTRKNVEGALDKMLSQLRLLKFNPPNGVALFAGNVSDKEGKDDFQSWWVEPPSPLNIRIYKCDKTFELGPLEQYLETKEVYGLVVMDRREGTIALLKGKSIIILDKTSSNVPGKTKAGGQSSVRFAQLRENATVDFFKKIAEMMKKHYLTLAAEHKLKGIILGGPGHTKYEFRDKDYITDQVNKKIIAVKDVSYTDEFGIQELLEKSEDVLAQESVAEEKKVVGDFFLKLATNQKIVAYGINRVKEALELGAVDLLLLSETLEDNVVEEFQELAKKYGTKVMIVSIETREGVQLRDIGKIGAILRYAI